MLHLRSIAFRTAGADQDALRRRSPWNLKHTPVITRLITQLNQIDPMSQLLQLFVQTGCKNDALVLSLTEGRRARSISKTEGLRYIA